MRLLCRFGAGLRIGPARCGAAEIATACAATGIELARRRRNIVARCAAALSLAFAALATYGAIITATTATTTTTTAATTASASLTTLTRSIAAIT